MKIFCFMKENEGAGLAEYAILILLIALVCIAIMGTMGEAISALFTTASGMFG